MKIKEFFSTKNKTPWVNTKKYIITHHTWTWEWSIKGVLSTLTVWKVSCHYVIDTNGDIYKIWDDKDILWHAGTSEWGNLKWMNTHSIGIEIIWPLLNWFTFEQRKVARDIIQELMHTHNIPRENVLRHADLTHAWSSKRILWDWKSRSRKVDIDIRFLNDSEWKPKYASWKEYQNSLA